MTARKASSRKANTTFATARAENRCCTKLKPQLSAPSTVTTAASVSNSCNCGLPASRSIPREIRIGDTVELSEISETIAATSPTLPIWGRK